MRDAVLQSDVGRGGGGSKEAQNMSRRRGDTANIKNAIAVLPKRWSGQTNLAAAFTGC